ncbi:MAG: transcriptional activator NhaR [Gammaproteobacteria bacterium]|nr:transcriptional activator NhaR [Gammaproteobacteria bacterium]
MATNINYKHLRYFWIVAKEGSIARASDKLCLTPQTISGQIKVFEESIGVALFKRTGKRLILTEAGRVTMNYAEEIFSLGSELKEVLSSRPTGRPLRFTIGVTDVIPKLIAYRLIEPALHLPDPLKVICHENKLDNLLADIAVHKLDMIITDSPVRPNMNVKAFNHRLGECGVTFFATPQLAESYRDNFPHSLEQAPLLLPSSESAVHSTIVQWFDELQVHPHIVGEFDDSALMKAFGQAGVGVFSAPTVIQHEVTRQYKVEAIGSTTAIREQFYAVSAERKLKHPAVVAICHSARFEIFGGSDDTDCAD